MRSPKCFKWAFLIPIFLFFLIPLVCAESYFNPDWNTPSRTDHCLYTNESVFFNTSTVDYCSDYTGANKCANIFDANVNTYWTTTEDAAHDIPGYKPSMVFSKSDGGTWDIGNLTVYVEFGVINGQKVPTKTAPNAFKIYFYYEGAWHEQLSVSNFSNDVAQNCSTILNTNALNNFCGVSVQDAFGVSKIKINVSDVWNSTGATSNMIFPELAACGEPAQVCDFPILFCDNFNYADGLYITKGWSVFNADGSTDTDLTPTNDQLRLLEENVKTPSHETQPFNANYWLSGDTIETSSRYSPVFSSQFKINVSANNLTYTAGQDAGKDVYNVKFVNTGSGLSIYVLNETRGYRQICTNCIGAGDYVDIKINTYFKQRDVFPFNSTVSTDQVVIYANNTLIGNQNFIDSTADYLGYYQFGKTLKDNVSIDDYFVMVGTSKNSDTSLIYYFPLYDNTTSTETATGQTADLAPAVASIWKDMGLKSTASKVMAGLFLMFMLAIFYIVVMVQRGIEVKTIPLLVLEIFFMILLVYIKLLPIWIPIVIGIMGAGVAALIFKMSSSGGG